MELTQAAARALLLAAQGLLAPLPHPATKADVLGTIRRMGVLQIDTIHIVARSPYLVLWSRLGPYEPRWLDELLAEGALFEYWSHAACFLPIEDFPLYWHRMLAKRSPEGRWKAWADANAAVIAHVHQRVRENGPLRSADFERHGPAGAWWDWKPEKTALELLFDQGHLMIARREQFQRVYDLRERVLPSWDDAAALTPEAARRQWVLASVRQLGLTPARWVPDYYRLKKQGIVATLAGLVREGVIHELRVQGWDEPAYLHDDNLALAERAAAGQLLPSRTTLLSPFDPIVWDRARALELFNFHYRIEVYTPAARRAYGYFTLPILHQGQIVGRLDPKAHRAQGLFEVKAIHLEPWVPIDEKLITGLAGAITECALWHGTPEIRLLRSEPPELRDALRSQIADCSL